MQYTIQVKVQEGNVPVPHYCPGAERDEGVVRVCCYCIVGEHTEEEVSVQVFLKISYENLHIQL
jgi:hypothetical protein